jgi:hypothetical protein
MVKTRQLPEEDRPLRAANGLPFNASSSVGSVGPEVLLEYRPLAVRNDAVGSVFRVQAALEPDRGAGEGLTRWTLAPLQGVVHLIGA